MQLPGRNRTDGTVGTTDNPTGRIRMEAETGVLSSGTGINLSYNASSGQAIGPINNGGYADYTISASVAGTYTLRLRLGNQYAYGAQLQVRSSNGAVLATVNVSNTADWNVYYTAITTISLPAGVQTLRLYSSNSAWTLDYLELIPPGTLSGFNTTPSIFHAEAEDYMEQSGGIQTETCLDAGGTQNIAPAGQGAWLDYRVSVPVAGTYTIRLRAASGNTGTANIVSAAGATLASIGIPQTGGYQTYTTVSGTIQLSGGEQTIRVYVQNPYFALNWLEIETPPGTDNYALTLSDHGSTGGGMIYDADNTFTVEFLVKPVTTHEIDVQSNSGIAGESGQKYVFYPLSGGSGDANSGSAGMGISIGTNGVSVYEHGDNYTPATLVWEAPAGEELTDWTHVAVVYNSGMPSLYINGEFKKTGVHSGRPHVYPSTQFPGGGYATAGGGKLDEIRIWKVARTQQQIRDNMNGEIAGTNPDLAGYWPMNEGGGTTLHDISSNGRDINLNGNDYNSSNWTLGRSSTESKTTYRYGFNGQEHSYEIGDDDYTAQFWEYDSRLGRRWNVDPVPNVSISSYAVFDCNPIWKNDLKGNKPNKIIQSVAYSKDKAGNTEVKANITIYARIKVLDLTGKGSLLSSTLQSSSVQLDGGAGNYTGSQQYRSDGKKFEQNKNGSFKPVKFTGTINVVYTFQIIKSVKQIDAGDNVLIIAENVKDNGVKVSGVTPSNNTSIMDINSTRNQDELLHTAIHEVTHQFGLSDEYLKLSDGTFKSRYNNNLMDLKGYSLTEEQRGKLIGWTINEVGLDKNSQQPVNTKQLTENAISNNSSSSVQ